MNNDKPGNPGKTIYYVQQIVDFMNERPDKLFGGKYKSFSAEEGNEISAYYLKRHVHPEDGEYFLDEWDFLSFDSTSLLRELAKAKWGDETLMLVEEDMGFGTRRLRWTTIEDKKKEWSQVMAEPTYLYKLKKWVMYADEAKRIACIAKDILS